MLGISVTLTETVFVYLCICIYVFAHQIIGNIIFEVLVPSPFQKYKTFDPNCICVFVYLYLSLDVRHLVTLFLRSLNTLLFENIVHHGSFLPLSYKWMGWVWVWDWVGWILWASLCNANKHEGLEYETWKISKYFFLHIPVFFCENAIWNWQIF